MTNTNFLSDRLKQTIKPMEKQLKTEMMTYHPIAHILDSQKMLESIYASLESLGYNVDLRRRYFNNRVNQYFKEINSNPSNTIHTRFDVEAFDSPYDSDKQI